MSKTLLSKSLLEILKHQKSLQPLKYFDKRYAQTIVQELNKKEGTQYIYDRTIAIRGEGIVLRIVHEKKYKTLKVALPTEVSYNPFAQKIKMIEIKDISEISTRELLPSEINIEKIPVAAARFLLSAFAQDLLSIRVIEKNLGVYGHIPIVHKIGKSLKYPWFCMEYISGQAFGNWIDGKSKYAKIIFFKNFLKLIYHAMHQKGLIHTDLKPGNLLVRNDKPVLIDFGNYKDLNKLRKESVRLTAQGEGRASPLYRPLELCAGRSAHARNFRADFYGAGILLWVLWNGVEPHIPDDIDLSSHDELAKLYNPEIFDKDTKLKKIFLRATARDSEDRHEDITQIIEEISLVLEDYEEKKCSDDNAWKAHVKPEHIPIITTTMEMFDLWKNC